VSCVLRIGGAEVDVDALIASCGLVPYRVDRKGSPQRLRSRGPHERSSIHVDVSSADFSDLPTQVADAIAFLDAHEQLIRTAATFPGVETAVLDFALEIRNVAINSKLLPPDLLLRAGALGVAIELSLYPEAPSDDEESSPA